MHSNVRPRELIERVQRGESPEHVVQEINVLRTVSRAASAAASKLFKPIKRWVDRLLKKGKEELLLSISRRVMEQHNQRDLVILFDNLRRHYQEGSISRDEFQEKIHDILYRAEKRIGQDAFLQSIEQEFQK